MSMSDSALTNCQEWMKSQGLSAFLFTVADRFQGEEIQPCDRYLVHLVGFPGSAGALVVTPDGGTLLVDGRYTIKGQEIADACGLDLAELKAGAVANTLAEALSEGEGAGEEGRWGGLADTLSHSILSALVKEIPSFKAYNSQDMNAWWHNRPAEAFASVHGAHPLLSARTTEAKVQALWEEAAKAKPDTGIILVSDPAEVAWLLNVRGADTPPLTTFRARLLVQKRGKIRFFGAQTHRDAIEALEGLAFFAEHELPQHLSQMQGTVWMCPNETPYALVQAVAEEIRHLAATPIHMLKAMKDADEVEGMRQAHLDDAVAMVRFLHWLEDAVPVGGVDEAAATNRLWDFRSAAGAFAVSFDTISAVGPNAALPHYRSTPATNRMLSSDEIYLVDSGGQFESGTTDITRTLWFGDQPPADFVRHNTQVLRGHIDLAKIKFPRGVDGYRLDTLARHHLWNGGLDFGHGTGHGVGAGLNVHESPPTIAPRPGASMTAFAPGMIVSNEPGYYQPGSHGIRIECLQVCQPVPDQDGWLAFEVLTLVPIQTKMIDVNLLDDAQLRWLNEFHCRVLEMVAPRLDLTEDKPVIEWLTDACKPLTKTKP